MTSLARGWAAAAVRDYFRIRAKPSAPHDDAMRLPQTWGIYIITYIFKVIYCINTSKVFTCNE